MMKLKIRKVVGAGNITAWTCPKCKNEGQFYGIPPLYCLSCDIMLPNMSLLTSNVEARITYYSFWKGGRTC